MNKTHLFCGVAFAATLVVTPLACGARSELEIPDPPDHNTGGGPPECVVFNSSAALAPLDMFVMLDSSGSMLDITAGGVEKWAAVRTAFDAFVHDGESRGITVSLAFFPIVDLSVPEDCFDDTACGAPDTCQLIDFCPSTGIQCGDDADCAAAGVPEACVGFGRCLNTTSQIVFCNVQAQDCPTGTGPCQQAGFCENRFTCDTPPYGNQVFGPKALPDAADGFVSAIANQSPIGGTPTLPALTGAIDNAVSWSEANPTHNVIVVLVTDGVPSVCDPALETDPMQAQQNMADVAAFGASRGVQTWAIGVFAPSEELDGGQNLDAIAAAGGTGSAFVITTSDVVSNEFLEALNQVRLNAKACEFSFDPEEDVAFEDVWVKITPSTGEPVWVPYVGPSGCDGQSQGFDYDALPPTKIILCPQTCSVLGASPNRTVEIFTTCPDPQSQD